MSTPRDRIEARLGMTGASLRAIRSEPPAVPDHTLLRRIGQGAYGEVWLAQTALGTARAIKIVHQDNFRDRRPYEREFAGIRRFEPLSRSNEGFVDILQVGRNDAEGWFYYVMELADPVAPNSQPADPDLAPTPEAFTPRTLSRDLQQRGRLALEECLELGLTLSLALGHLHRHGLIHRDIKPSNIIFVGGVPKLADIGLVTEAAEANTFVGTEGFVPPEGPTSPQADLYALGKVLYEAAMGKDRNEFPEPYTRIGTDPESVALMELNAVLLRACAPDPKSRYATAEEMHADLALLHSGGSVKRRQQFERQFRVAKRIGAVAIMLALFAGSAWWWQQRQTSRMYELADANANLALEKTVLAESLVRIGEENRNRVVRLNIANGIRLLDEDDPVGAPLWFADALPLLADRPDEQSLHRIRIQQTLDQVPRVLRIFTHDSSPITSAFSPNGQWIATGTDKGVHLWDAASGALVWQLMDFEGPVCHVRFSKDGQRLFASSTPEQIAFNGDRPTRNFYAVLETASGRLLWPPPDASRSTNLLCSAFSPDDCWLAVGVANSIELYDLNDDFRLVADLQGHNDLVRYVSFSASGELLASASLDRTVRAWRVPSGEPVGGPLEHRFPVVRVFLNDTGEYALSAAFETPGKEWDGAGPWEVQAWHVPSAPSIGEPFKGTNWAVMFIEPGPNGRAFTKTRDGFRGYSFEPFAPALPTSVPNPHAWSFSSDRRRMAFGGGTGLAHVYDAKTGDVLYGPLRHSEWLNTVALSPDEKTLLTGGNDTTARLWDLSPKRQESARNTLPAAMQHARPEYHVQDQSALALYLQDGTLRLFDEDLQERHRFRSPKEGANYRGIWRRWHSEIWASKQYSPDAKSILLWRVEDQENPGIWLAHPAEVKWWEFTSDDRYLITLSEDQLIRFWRTADGLLERSVQEPEPELGFVADGSPDGETGLWILRGEQNLVRFVDLHSGEFTSELFATEGHAWTWTFSPDGKQVAFLDLHGPVLVVESRTGRILSRSIKHSSNLVSVNWSPDSRHLLTAGYGEAVLVWDPATGRQLLPPLRTPGDAARFARWSPDGRLIITLNGPNARVWDALASSWSIFPSHWCGRGWPKAGVRALAPQRWHAAAWSLLGI